MNLELAGGIDVSHYKKQIDWTKVKETGVSFAFIKATEAENFVDARFDYNWTRTRRVGMLRGAYHFFRPLVDPILQAQNFLKIVGPILHETDLPPVLDVEVYPDFIEREYKRISVEERIQRIQVWLQTVERVTGKVPIIYTEYYTWYDYIGNTQRFIRNPLWIANYRVDKPKVPAEDWGGNGWTFWQTTERGVVPGIRDEAPCVDLDLYRGSFEDMRAWLNITGERALPPDVTNGDMMAAIVDAADKAGASSSDWVTRAGLTYLVNPVGNSLRPYDGPAVQDLALTGKEKEQLAFALEKYVGKNSSAWSITHQDLINAFFYAASLEDTGGWSLVERAGIGYIGLDRDLLYSGPVVSELPGLTLKQKEAIMAYLGLSRPEKESAVEEPVSEVQPEEPAVEEQESAEESVEEPQEEPVPVPADPAPDPVEQEIPEQEDPALEDVVFLDPTYGSEMNNQAVINAFYLAGITLDINGRDLITAAGLEGLASDRLDVYTGPRIEDLPGLTGEQRKVIAGLLEVELPEQIEVVDEPAPVEPELPPEEATPPAEEQEPEISAPAPQPEVEPTEPPQEPQPEEQPAEEPAKPPYFGLLNQDIIDLFYRAAAFFNESGLDWLIKVGLEYLGKDREARYKMYRGPQVEHIKGLTEEQQTQLVAMLSRYRQS